MTLIVGWLACDQRGPCSAYIASDSRISNNIDCYDNSQKVFALKNTPDILGYCGETLFTYQILSRLTNMCDSGMILSQNMDYQERSEFFFNEIKKAHREYKINDSDIRIYHIGRNSKKVFDASLYAWKGMRTFSWTAHTTRPRLCRYSQGLIFPSDVLILFVLYHTRYSFKVSTNSGRLTPVHSR